MIQLDVVQGDELWHIARAKYPRTASLAPAIMGSSKKRSRNDAIRFLATGVDREFSQWVQDNLLDRGHLIESFAKPLAEKIIGKKLYPITAISDDEYMLASYDGISADDEDAWECKSWNEKKAEDVRAGNIPDEDVWQVVQQLAIGAKRCLYMVTDGTAEKTVYCWMVRDEINSLIGELIAGWNQADNDAANYQYIEHAEKPSASPTIGLPALFAQVEGKFNLATNIDLFSRELKQFVGNMDLSPTDDQGFADLEAQVKVCAQAEESIKAQVLGARGQMVSFDDFCKTAELLLAIAARARIDGTNAIKDKKVAIKAKAIADAKALFAAHVAGLEAEIAPIRLIVEQPDFVVATKGLKGLKSLHNEIDTALAKGKIAADAVAKDVRHKLANMATVSEYAFLFPDLQQFIFKPADDFTLIVTSRIAKHEAEAAAKLEAERARIQALEEAKATAKVKAAQDAEDVIIDSLRKNANRIEFESVPYIQKAINAFEVIAVDWEDDPRHRIVAAVVEARIMLAGRLATAKTKAAQDALLAAEREKMEAEVRAEAKSKAGIGIAFVAKAEADAIDAAEQRAHEKALIDEPYVLQPAMPTLLGIPPDFPRITSAKIVNLAKPIRPPRNALLAAIADGFGVNDKTALDWILVEFAGDIKFEMEKSA